MAGSLRCGNSRGRGVYGWKGLRSQSVTEDEIVNYSDEPIDRRLEISHLSMVHGTVFFVSFFKDSLEFLEFLFSQSRRLLDFWINQCSQKYFEKEMQDGIFKSMNEFSLELWRRISVIWGAKKEGKKVKLKRLFISPRRKVIKYIFEERKMQK